MHSLSPSFVEIYPKMTKLCCFKQVTPFIERHAELAASELSRVYWKESVAPKLSRFEPARLSRLAWGAMLEKYRNFSRSLRWLMSWKSPCRPSGKSCDKNTSTRSWWTLP